MVSFLFLLILFTLKTCEGSSDLTPISSLSGKQLKAAITQIPGMFTILRNASGSIINYGGFMYEELQFISLQLNFTVKMDTPKDGTYGELLVNGSWTGFKGLLQREEVDIACNGFSGQSGFDIMNLAVYLGPDGYGILTPYPQPKTSIYATIQVFSAKVWIGLLIAIVVCIGSIKLFAYLTRKYFPTGNDSNNHHPRGFTTLSDAVMYIFATLTNHGGYYRDGHRSIGMVAVTWSLATFVFVTIYASCITSYMSLVTQRPEINYLKDIVTNQNYKLITKKQGTAEIMFLTSKEPGVMKEIGDKLRRCTDGTCSLENFLQIGDKVLKGHHVAVLPITFNDIFILQTFKSNNKCKLTMGKETMANYQYFMAVPKNSPNVEELNKASFWFAAFGLAEYWAKKTVPLAKQCRLQYDSRGEFVQLVDKVPLKLEQFYLAFVVLFIGYLLALMQFIRERFIR